MINKIYNTKSTNNNYNITFGAKPIPKDVAMRLYKELLKDESYGVYCHETPDKDTAKAGTVFTRWLKRQGKKAFLFVENKDLKELGLKKSQIESSYHKTDRNLFVDFNSMTRLPKNFQKVFKVNSSKNIGFDHHLPANPVIQGDFYIDSTAKSCCAVIYRFFEAIGEKIQKRDLKDLYSGIISDYGKSKLIKIEDSKMVRLHALNENPDAKEVLDKIESQLSEKDKASIIKKADIMSNLSKAEENFKNRLKNDIKLTKNGKIAYVVLPPNDKQWQALGMDNNRTSEIIRDFRIKTINSREETPRLKDIKAVMIFYREKPTSDSCYKMSIHSIDDYAKHILNHVELHSKDKITLGGHANRAGGKIYSINKKDTVSFVNSFLQASQEV